MPGFRYDPDVHYNDVHYNLEQAQAMLGLNETELKIQISEGEIRALRSDQNAIIFLKEEVHRYRGDPVPPARSGYGTMD